MKKGEKIRLVNVDAELVDCLTISKEAKARYKIVLEQDSRIHVKESDSSAEIRKIIRVAEKLGYKIEKESANGEKEVAAINSNAGC